MLWHATACYSTQNHHQTADRGMQHENTLLSQYPMFAWPPTVTLFMSRCWQAPAEPLACNCSSMAQWYHRGRSTMWSDCTATAVIGHHVGYNRHSMTDRQAVVLSTGAADISITSLNTQNKRGTATANHASTRCLAWSWVSGFQTALELVLFVMLIACTECCRSLLVVMVQALVAGPLAAPGVAEQEPVVLLLTLGHVDKVRLC